MTKTEIAARLGVHETTVSTVDEHPAGLVATLRDGRQMLVTETVARVYLPEVDDIAADTETSTSDEPAPVKAPAKKAVKGKSSAAR